jgi:hypothetical protein
MKKRYIIMRIAFDFDVAPYDYKHYLTESDAEKAMTKYVKDNPELVFYIQLVYKK